MQHLSSLAPTRIRAASPARPFRSLRWRVSFAVAALLVIMVFQVLLRPLPQPVMVWSLRASSGWLLSGDEDNPASVTKAVRKLIGLTLQQSVAAHAYRSQRVPEGLSDAKRLAFRLSQLKEALIDQTELLHSPVSSPVGIAGVGWCDSVNGFAATVLSHEFQHAEIVGVWDPVAQGGHSFGRVWSAEARDWLYFDLWGDETVVFRSSREHGLRYLARIRPRWLRSLPDAHQQSMARVRSLAYSGLVHNKLQPTLGGYIGHRVINWIKHGDTAPEGVRAALDRVPPNGSVSRVPMPLNRTKASEAYLQARYYHLIGDLADARRGYSEVLREEGNQLSTYGRAAKIFLRRIPIK